MMVESRTGVSDTRHPAVCRPVGRHQLTWLGWDQAVPEVASTADPWNSTPANMKSTPDGYLLGTVSADGTIAFSFQQVRESDVPASIVHEYTQNVVHDCFVGNTAGR